MSIVKRQRTIGFPKGLIFYEHSDIWEEFFQSLGFKVIKSEDTNKKILDDGVNYCSNETCLPVKVFHGHVLNMADKADYIFVPRYKSTDDDEFCCPKLCSLPDMVRLNLKLDKRVVEVILNKMEESKTVESLKKLADILDIGFDDVISAYQRYISHRLYNKSDFKAVSSDSPALVVLGHPYMIYDNYISMKLIKKLKEYNYEVFTPREIDHEIKRSNSHPYINRFFYNVGLDNLGTAFKLAESKSVKGIIYLTPFACGIDSLVTEFIEIRLKDHYKIPWLKLTVDEHTGEAGFDTRIEAFLDMVK